MPTNTLTPEEMAMLRRYYASGAPSVYRDANGNYLQNNAATPQGQDNVGFAPESNGMLGYSGADNHVGGTFQKYGTDGSDQGQGQFQEVNNMKDFMKWLAISGALAGGISAAGFGGSGGAAAGGMGYGDATAMGYDPAAFGGGLETMPSMTTGLEPLAASTATASATGAGTGALETMGSMTSGLSPLTASSAIASGAGGWGSFLGPAAALLGGALGSQPQTKETTSQQQIDPRMVPYLYGDQGLLSGIQQQLQRSTSPQTRAQWDALAAAGQGMFSQPVAGNGYARLTGR